MSQDQIESIKQNYESDDISFPLPDKKLHGKCFLRFNLKKSARMYNLCQSTTRKISAATYLRYKPKAVKLQGRIPFRQSCCELVMLLITACVIIVGTSQILHVFYIPVKSVVLTNTRKRSLLLMLQKLLTKARGS